MITNFDDWRGFLIDVHHVFTVIVTVPCKYEMWKITHWWLRWRQRKNHDDDNVCDWLWLWLMNCRFRECRSLLPYCYWTWTTLTLSSVLPTCSTSRARLPSSGSTRTWWDLVLVFVHHSSVCVSSGVVRIDPLHFLAGCRTRRLNCLSYILACFIVLLFIRAPFYVLLVFVAMCYVFLVVLVELSVLAKWLARKTPLRKPNRGAGTPAWYIILLLWRDIAYLSWKCR